MLFVVGGSGGAGWSVLGDDYGMGAGLKDWDKGSDDDGDGSDE